MSPLYSDGKCGIGSSCRRFALNRPTLLLLALLGLEVPAFAATNTVTSLADAGPGSLREVVSNALPGDTIVFSVTGVIRLSGSELLLEKPVTIRGPGANTLMISGHIGGRIFRVATNNVVSLSGMTLSDAAPDGAPGGAIHNAGSLAVSDCVFSNNATGFAWAPQPGASGGAICNVGDLALTSSILRGNRAADGANGSGGYDTGQSGQPGGSGGAIWNSGTLSASLCCFADNKAGSGGYGANGRVTGGSGGSGGSGGAIYSLGSVTLTDCTLSNNISGSGGSGGSAIATGGSAGGGGSGGGIHTSHGVFTGCTIVSNRAGWGGYGGGANFTGGSGASGGFGGGISCGTEVFLTNCTVVGNSSGSGGSGGFAISPGYNGGGGYGGGLSGKATLVACTVVNNLAGSSADGQNGHGGGVADFWGGQVLNTIIARNSGQPSDAYGNSVSLGHNLIGTTNGAAGFKQSTDRTGSDSAPLDPGIGPVGDYGGPTPTVPLLAGSPAIDAGTGSGVPSTDQRNIPRPQGFAPDIGAFEFQFAIPRISAGNGLTNGGLLLQCCGLPMHNYTLQLSTNLLNWSSLAELLTGPDGLDDYTDSEAVAFRQRFYRLKTGSP